MPETERSSKEGALTPPKTSESRPPGHPVATRNRPFGESPDQIITVGAREPTKKDELPPSPDDPDSDDDDVREQIANQLSLQNADEPESDEDSDLQSRYIDALVVIRILNGWMANMPAKLRRQKSTSPEGSIAKGLYFGHINADMEEYNIKEELAHRIKGVEL